MVRMDFYRISMGFLWPPTMASSCQMPGRDIGLETSARACFEAHVTWPSIDGAHLFEKSIVFCLVFLFGDVIGAIITTKKYP